MSFVVYVRDGSDLPDCFTDIVILLVYMLIINFWSYCICIYVLLFQVARFCVLWCFERLCTQ